MVDAAHRPLPHRPELSHSQVLRRQLVESALRSVENWETSWGPYAPVATGVDASLPSLFEDYLQRLNATAPFFHPRFVGQMIKSPHPVATGAYLAALAMNPNNHAIDASQATSPMEKEVVSLLSQMFRLPPASIGHLTSSGTIANLEALWVARELTSGARVLFSADAHYTHRRMCQVLAVPCTAVPTGVDGRVDMDAVEAELAKGDVGCLVVTAGTTGTGLLDDIAEGVRLGKQYGARVHVDAAYGGFFAVLGEHEAYAAIAECDSVVVDPHKHGLQPYGCGAVLFSDASVGQLYRHDSPYTYFTSDELHLGEISLECSRAGAAAGALWLTLQALPLNPDHGMGPLLRECLGAARDFAAAIQDSQQFQLHVDPTLDIVTYFPVRDSLSAIDQASRSILSRGMNDSEDPVFLSTLTVPATTFGLLHPEVLIDRPDVTILRSVFMKPEHRPFVPSLVKRLTQLDPRS